MAIGTNRKIKAKKMNLYQKHIRKYFYVGLLIVVFYDCNNQKANNNTKVFRFNLHNAITSLDPAFAKSQANIWVVNQLFNSLLQLDDSLNIKPCIAKDYKISADGLTYTFHLRNDVFFHEDECFGAAKTRKVVAEDVKYSFERILDATLASPGSWVFKGKIAASQAFMAINDTTFILKLAKPFRPMLGILTMQYCSIVPKEAVEHYGKAFRSHPVGTGAFKLKKWLEGQGVFMAKNEKYFEQDESGIPLPYIDGIKISCIPERKTAFLELITNKLDYLFGLESAYVNELITPYGELVPAQREKLDFIKAPYLNTEYIGINMSQSHVALSNKKVRQAMNYAIDRKKMLKALRNSVGKAATGGFCPMGLPSFDATQTKGYSYNPDKARLLLDEAGFAEGKGLGEISLHTSNDYADICTFLANEWSKIGLKVNIDIVEAATLREMMTKGQTTFFRASWIADYPDAESFLGVFYSKNPAPPNYTRFQNPAYDALYEASLAENDDAKRYALYQKMDTILLDEAPVIFLFYDEIASFKTKNIEGLSKNAMNLLILKGVKK
jgi:oligopeptide transport system substrate-binding protein